MADVKDIDIKEKDLKDTHPPYRGQFTGDSRRFNSSTPSSRTKLLLTSLLQIQIQTPRQTFCVPLVSIFRRMTLLSSR